MRNRLLRPLFALALMAGVLLWTGCEGSPVPLSEPSVAVDPALLGAWRLIDEDGDETERADVYRFNDVEYVVRYTEMDEDDDEPEISLLRMFVTDVDGQPFVNLLCLDCSDDEDWFFMALDASEPGVARLSPVKDDLYEDLPESVQPKDVLAALRLLLQGPDPLDATGVFVRIED